MEINKELYSKFSVKLFIAGGDAMRRYDPDISFTKDIDTKLYINNAVTKSKLSKIDEEKAKRLAVHKDIDELYSTTPVMVLQKRGIIKKQIIDTIAKHIVKLRNYLEQNISAILEYRGTTIYSSDRDYNYIICLSSVPDNKINNQRFRTREIRKSKEFPVDLYSLDFKTYLIKKNKNGEIINIKDLNISVLDVVLEDDGDYHPYYHTNVDIPVASPYFIINDFTNTYKNDDRALARIASDKYIKDIERYNKMYKIYQEYDESTFSVVEPEYIKNINDIESHPFKESIIVNTVDIQSFKNDVKEIIMKIKSQTPFNIDDFIKVLNMMNNKNFNKIRDDLRKFLEDFGNFKTNLYFEDLNKIDIGYLSYRSNITIHDDKHYVDNYLDLFNHIISQIDGKQKHVISFSNKMIKTAIKGMQKQLSLTSARSGPSRTPRVPNITLNKEKRKELSPTQSSKSTTLSKRSRALR
jgi:hypothetical protein